MFLAEPIIKQIFEAVVNYAAGKFSIDVQGGALKVVFAVQADEKLYDTLLKLAAYQKAQANGDTDAQSQALNDAVNSWGNLFHFGGVAPVVGA